MNTLTNNTHKPSEGPIVVGTDLSRGSIPIVDYAVTLAVAERRPLYLVYVMPIIPDDSLSLIEIQRNELRNQVNSAKATMSRHGLSVEPVFVTGNAVHEIIRTADSLHTSYLVVGTNGFEGLDRFLLGSVAEAVIRKADCPVIVVGPEAAKGATKTIPWKHLMLACDTAHGITQAATLAANLAVYHRAQLTLFTVQQEGLETVTEDQFDAMEPMMSREAWLTIMPQCLIREGDPASEIVRMAEDTQSDLLIMSVRSGGELLTHLRGGIIAKVLRTSRCPAMIFRDLPAVRGESDGIIAQRP